MYTTHQEDNKANVIAASVSLFFGTALVLILLFWIIEIPNPPFPEAGGQSGVEMSVGVYDAMTGEIQETEVGKPTDVITEEVPVEDPVKENESNNGEPVLEEPIKPKVTTNTTVIPVKPKPKVNPLLNAYNNGPKGAGGTNPNGILEPGGAPKGGTTAGSTGSTGGSTAGSTGGSTSGTTSGTGPGHSDIGGGINVNMAGRKRLSKPCPISDVHESGTVEVIIVVDESGKIISANPNGKGTLTNSANLKTIAKHAVDCVSFSPAPAGSGDQTGSITFNFVFN